LKEESRFKKRLFLGLLLIFVLFIVSGCGENFDLHRTEQEVNFWKVPLEPVEVNIAGIETKLNLNTVYFTWVAMALTLLLGFAAARGCSVRRPTKLASMMELVFDFLKSQLYGSMAEKKARGIYLLIISYFLFILVCNLMGLVPTLEAPTGDINTTLGLALITFVMIYVWGLRYTGPKMFKHYIMPIPILPIVEDFAKPVTLAFRLFGNMKGKHIMTVALLGLITGMAEYCGGFLASVVWLAFGIFVSAIQAFVFTVLSIAYISMVVSDDHH